MKTLYLCGAGNPEGVRLAITINEREARWDRIFVLDDDPAKHGEKILGVEIAGPFELLGQADAGAAEVANLVARTTAKRMAARGRIEAFGLPLATLVHPRVDTRGVRLGKETTVYSNATLSANASLGDSSVVLTGAIVGHGCQIGNCCVVGPGAVINARVRVGDCAYIGTNAAILPDLTVGRSATVGACSAVIVDVPEGATVMGVPAQTLVTTGVQPDLDPPTSGNSVSISERDHATPQSSTEIALAGLWQQALGVERIGLHDDFFQLGGNSLLAVEILFKIQEQFHVRLSLQAFLKTPTVARLANEIDLGLLDEAG